MSVVRATGGGVFGGAEAWEVRREFPALSREVGGGPLVYLDNAATTQKPAAVLDAVRSFYERSNANVHRGVHTLSREATEAYERARGVVRRFVGGDGVGDVVFTRGVTESMNLVACSWGRANLGPGDEVVVSRMEHHSVIVPWQMACESAGASLRVAPITGRGELDLAGLRSVVGDRTRAVCVCHVSNTLGTVNPVREVCEIAREAGAVSVVDGAQAAAHEGVDVSSIGCDFYALSGHKAFGPMGIGALWGRGEVLESMGPWQGGGEMITRVSFDSGIGYAGVPGRFEAGTPNVAGAVGFAAALEFLGDLGGPERWRDYERGLCEMLTDVVEGVGGSRVIGVAGGKAPVVSFVVDGVHPHDLGTYLDTEGVAVRTGHHCTQPLMEWFGVPATTRASLAFYNTESEIEAFGGALGRAVEFFR